MATPTRPQKRAAPLRPVLIVTPPGSEQDGLFRELHDRSDLLILYATSTAEAEQALRGRAVSVVIASPEVPTAGINELLASKERLRPGLPLLVIRNRQAEEPAGWRQGGVGILRCPLLPEVLGRTVEVVLGLRT